MAEAVQTAARAEPGQEPAAGVGSFEAATAPEPRCPSCGVALAGDFCHACGEKRPQSRDLSVRHFFSEAAQELTSVEHSKLFHTVRALLFRPGFLTNEWIGGRRRRYLKPLNLCLGILALSLFAYSVYKPVSMFDIEKFIRQDKSGDSVRMFERLAARKHVELPELLDRIGERWQRYMSLTPLLQVGAFALVLQLAFVFSRRYFVEHLVFSMHFVSFSTLAVLLLWPVYFFVGVKTGGVNSLVAVFKWALDIAYMYFAVRAVYGLGALRTLVVSVLLVVGYLVGYLLILGGALGAALASVILS
ncbi:MAG TPA: DUF3667 domain-containing protein [Pyrinomonadaceae bacterium]